MPEVLEIKRYANFLNKYLKNQYINKINILNGRYKKYGPFPLYNELTKNLPLKVIDIKTKGKFLYFILEKDFFIFSTLGLSGGWTYKSNSSKNYEFPQLLDYIPNEKMIQYKKTVLNHLNVVFETTKGSVYYYDTLSFGTLKVVNKIKELENKLKSLAPDIMDKTTTYTVFNNQIKKIKNNEKEIGLALMDQKVISGIGNYLRSDILWLSKISPFRKIKDLTNNDLKKIYKNAKLLTLGEYNFNSAIKTKNVKKTNKLPKNYGRDFFVYKMKEDIKGNPIIKIPLYTGKIKRFIYWVKDYQI